ncbi:hypothetical protein [Haloarchaeobius sp. DFWS5]|uniref:hypothetical protein n=1 Tax=Haloarchaeobius sp. DFWS5 TaxID=3446114 RepID=UPI003EBEC59A
MRTTVAAIAAVVLLVALVGGVVTLTGPDSPFDRNVVSERNPFAPDRPDTLNESTAGSYVVRYEAQRLHNDLLAARDQQLDQHDDVEATCVYTSVEETNDDAFRVEIGCRGDIEDVHRVFQSKGFEYTVTYRVTNNSTEQVAIDGYPYDQRDELDSPPNSST